MVIKRARKVIPVSTSIVCLLVITLYFSPAHNPFGSWKQNLANLREGITSRRFNKTSVVFDSQEFLLRRLVRGDARDCLNANGFSCYSEPRSELCVANKPVVIDTKTLTVYMPSNDSNQTPIERLIRPYANLDDETAMKTVSQVQILHGNNITTSPACQFHHDVPVLIFSTGGFTGNLFHEFDDVIIPLFITCHHFQSHLKFIITDYKPWMVRKYNRILSYLSRYEIINAAENSSVHCFPGAVIGLKFQDSLALNTSDIPGGYSMFDFKHFLRQSYNLKVKDVSELDTPVLLLISRSRSRRFLNEEEMVGMMEELGFRVMVATPNMMANLDKFADLVNSCSLLVGAHGAGLTNLVFLPAGAVMIQVVPLGLDWASNFYFGEPGRKMGMHYLEYKVEPEESSLLDKYGRDHPVIVNPASVFVEGYYASRAIYVDGQNLKINVTRFRKILVQAMEILGH